MVSPKEHEDDDQDDDQEDDDKDADEDVKERPQWLRTAFEVASDSGFEAQKTQRSTTSKVEDESKAESFASEAKSLGKRRRKER